MASHTSRLVALHHLEKYAGLELVAYGASLPKQCVLGALKDTGVIDYFDYVLHDSSSTDNLRELAGGLTLWITWPEQVDFLRIARTLDLQPQTRVAWWARLLNDD